MHFLSSEAVVVGGRVIRSLLSYEMENLNFHFQVKSNSLSLLMKPVLFLLSVIAYSRCVVINLIN